MVNLKRHTSQKAYIFSERCKLIWSLRRYYSMRRRSCLHTLLQILIIVALPLGASQAESDPFWNTNPYAWSAQTVTQNGRVRVTITKTKVHLAKKSRPIILSRVSDDDTDYYDELPYLQVGYRRPELINQSVDVDLSDEIKIRLLLARKRALEAYHATWS